MKNDIYGFKVDYHQIGNSEDVDDWVYTYTMKKIISGGHIPLKYSGSGTPKKSMSEILKDLTVQIPDGEVTLISKSSFRSKMCYTISDTKNGLSYLSIGHQKREKVESVEFVFLTSHQDLMVSFENYIKENFSNDKKNSVYVIAESNGSLNLHNLGPVESVLERDNYSKEVMKSYDHVVNEFSKKEPYGRLAVFNGPPGTGKTYLLRSLIGQMKDCLVVLLPSKLVGEIDSPSLITLLAEEKSEYGFFDPHGDGKQSLPILFIIEDADACLVPRESDNVLTISSLLNYTDGILGTMLDLRVVATTNQERIQFDEALMRPGRLCRHVTVDELSPERATEIHARLREEKRKEGKEIPEKLYKEKTPLAQVYADIQDPEDIKKEKEHKIGFV